MTFSLRNKYPGVLKLDVGFWKIYFCAVIIYSDRSQAIKGLRFRLQTSLEILK